MSGALLPRSGRARSRSRDLPEIVREDPGTIDSKRARAYWRSRSFEPWSHLSGRANQCGTQGGRAYNMVREDASHLAMASFGPVWVLQSVWEHGGGVLEPQRHG